MRKEDVYALLDTDPVAQALLTSPTPARMGYIGPDGAPRVIPIGFLYKDHLIQSFTVPTSRKVAALRSNPRVALTIDTETFPPHVLMVRGTATLDVLDGVPEEYLEASRKAVPAEQFAEFEAQVRVLYDQMTRIRITPTWARVLDFETRAPEAVVRIMREKGLG
jgi:hypothetical protein